MSRNQFTKTYAEYLRDESRVVGHADEIFFPKTESELTEIVKKHYENNKPITIQGARTGLSAAAVPFGGSIVNLSRMNKILGASYCKQSDKFYLTIHPGVLLIDLRKALLSKSFVINNWSTASIEALSELKAGEWSFMPDPTETSASIGGMLACNASGAKSFKYGSTREHIEAIRVLLVNGDILTVNRGQYLSSNNQFNIKTENGISMNIVMPILKVRNVKKNTAGYYVKPQMDLLDLFIGSEGTLGVITEIKIKLKRTPKYKWGITVFMSSEEKILNLVKALRGETLGDTISKFTFKPSAIEFFNNNALNLLRDQQKNNAAFAQIQELKDNYHTAVYIEIESDLYEELWEVAKEIGSLIEQLQGDSDDTWVAKRSNDLAKLKFFRHAIPECVNMQIDEARKTEPSLTKLGTDMSVRDEHLIQVMKVYNKGLAENNLKSVIFGHIGDNHLHVNIIPDNINDYEKGKKLYEEWSRKIAELGGSVSAEHAVGKLKKAFLSQMYTKDELKALRSIKLQFDPLQILNRGNIFDYQVEGSKNENNSMY